MEKNKSQPEEESWETADLADILPKPKSEPERQAFNDEDAPAEVQPALLTFPEKGSQPQEQTKTLDNTGVKSKKKESKREKRAKRKEEEAKKALEEIKQRVPLPLEEEKSHEKAGKILVVLPMTLPGNAKILYNEIFERMNKCCDVRLVDHSKMQKDARDTYPDKTAESKRLHYYEEQFRGHMTRYFTTPLDSRKVRIVFIDKVHPLEGLDKSLKACREIRAMKDVEYVYLGLAPRCVNPMKGYPFSYSHILYSVLSQIKRLWGINVDADPYGSMAIQLRFARMFKGVDSWKEVKEKYQLNGVIEYESEPGSEDAKVDPKIKSAIDNILKNLTGKEKRESKGKFDGSEGLRAISWEKVEEDWCGNAKFMSGIIKQICDQVGEVAQIKDMISLEEGTDHIQLLTSDVLTQYSAASPANKPVPAGEVKVELEVKSDITKEI